MAPYRPSQLDFYSPVSQNLYVTDIFNRYRLPLDEEHTVLVVSTSSRAATLWVIAYTILVTMIFMATCELATLMVLTYFRVGRSGTRHAMLIAYYNAGSPSRILPLMVGYIYNGLFRCKKAGRWTVDWTAVTASCLLFGVALSLLSGDVLTKFFLGGKALIQGHVAQVNPEAVYYPDFTATDESRANAIFDSYKARRAPAVYQAITRKTSTGYSNLHSASRILFKEEIIPIVNTTQRRFRYHYHLSGYELGLRDAPELLISVDGSCETVHGQGTVFGGTMEVIAAKGQEEEVNVYPFFNLTGEGELVKWGNVIPLEREKFTSPWVFFHFPEHQQTMEDSEKYGGWAFQLIPHTAHRLSRTQNPDPENPVTQPLDPWYETEPNPDWDEELDELGGAYNEPYRVKQRRPPIRCVQNDTYSYNGASVNHVGRLHELRSHGLKLSPLMEFVFQREFGIPVFAPLVGFAPFGSLASAVHYVPNERRFDAARANISTDIRELVEISYVYSREVVRNTVLLFPSIQSLQNPDEIIENAAAAGTNYSTVDRKDADFLIDSQDVAALSVVALIATPTVCAILWIIVLTWTCIFTSQTKLDNNSASGRHGLRRSGLQATHLYLFLDEQLSNERKWSGRQTNAPFIRNLDEPPPHERLSILMNQGMEKTDIEPQATSVSYPLEPTITQGGEVSSKFSKPKLVPVNGYAESATPEEGKGVWGWIKRTIFGIGTAGRVRYEVTMTRVWNPEIPPVKRDEIREDV